NGSLGSLDGMLATLSDLGKYVGAFLAAWPPRDGPEAGPIKRSSLGEMQQVWRPAPVTVGRAANGSPALNAGGYAYGLRGWRARTVPPRRPHTRARARAG